MPAIDDPHLMPLPHPVRVDAALPQPIERLMLEPLGVLDTLRPYLADVQVPTEWILNHAPGMHALALSSLGAPGNLNLGLITLVLARSRLRAQGDALLQVSPALHEQLAATDLGPQLPARFFRCPYPMAYIEFGRPSGMAIVNRLSGWHEVEGAYVGSYTAAPRSVIHHKTARRKFLGLDPVQPTRVVELVITGSPRGKANALDDASQNITLFIQDEEQCLATLLERHIAYYRSAEASDLPGFVSPGADELRSFEAVVYQLAKVLLYLNLPEAERESVPERSVLEARLRQVGPKKAKRLQRQRVRAYDRIVIGPRVSDVVAPTPAEPGGPQRRLRPHWRRGHFRRVRYGEGRSQSRLGWIQPVLVNAAEAFGPVRTKPYQLR